MKAYHFQHGKAKVMALTNGSQHVLDRQSCDQSREDTFMASKMVTVSSWKIKSSSQPAVPVDIDLRSSQGRLQALTSFTGLRV